VLIPRINAKFTRLETLYFHGQVGVRGESQSGEYRINLLDGAQESLFESAWRPLVPSHDEWLEVNARLALNQLQVGRYRLVVEVRLKDIQTQFLAREFDVIP